MRKMIKLGKDYLCDDIDECYRRRLDARTQMGDEKEN